jgi:4-alpha-glucanotransferase
METESFRSFCAGEALWLDDYAVFAAIKEQEQARPWWEWSLPWRDYSPEMVARAREELASAFDEKRVLQFFFHLQWLEARKEAARRGIIVLGDVPIFVAQDSAEVWSQRHLFQLDDQGLPTVIAGVPPDYFSATGQRWGNPLYDWPVHLSDGFAWWKQRMAKALELYDWVRVDHFRGFVDYWEIPASEPDAVKGRWMPSPGRQLFQALRTEFGERLNVVAEDLGVLSEAVTALREELGFPGMRILQFAFGTDPGAPEFLPEAYVDNCVAYTGTHDNDTAVSWFHDTGGSSLRSPEQCDRERRYCLRHLGIPGREIHWEMIDVLLRSKAGAAVFPMQDVLGLGAESRMNTPGTTSGNWRWRLQQGQLTGPIKERLRLLTQATGRNRSPLDLPALRPLLQASRA